MAFQIGRPQPSKKKSQVKDLDNRIAVLSVNIKNLGDLHNALAAQLQGVMKALNVLMIAHNVFMQKGLISDADIKSYIDQKNAENPAPQSEDGTGVESPDGHSGLKLLSPESGDDSDDTQDESSELESNDSGINPSS